MAKSSFEETDVKTEKKQEKSLSSLTEILIFCDLQK